MTGCGAAGGSSGPETPDEITGLIGWYDLTGDNSTVTITSSPDIDSVSDATGTAANDVAQSVASQKPHWNGTINGNTVADFDDPTSQYLEALTSPPICTALSGTPPSDATVICVLSSNDFSPGAASYSVPWGFGDGGGNQPTTRLHFYDTRIDMQRRTDANIICTMKVEPNPCSLSTTYAITLEVDGNDFRNSNLYVNDGSAESTTITANNAANGATTFTNFAIGARTADVFHWDGLIAEVIVYDNKISDDDRTGLYTNYLKPKYALP